MALAGQFLGECLDGIPHIEESGFEIDDTRYGDELAKGDRSISPYRSCGGARTTAIAVEDAPAHPLFDCRNEALAGQRCRVS